ncbi:hypothetical protein M422DRAFT_784491 [Sphaerobolus stellatus SS14]|uniref:Lysophospholipase n=1 Tax=Sphaerobolus stellatus (strain SS14) TaxID=990650 RepID=A0A0C9TGV6_SPHS4|nr:hypothetical protein M422DRAFT_784491 [Sphaerobolus stellatus SS14]
MSSNSDAYPTTSGSGCTTNFFRRVAPEQPLSQEETAYIAARLAVVQAAWEDWVGDASQLGYSSRQDALSNAAIIGIASGGGGLRAALFTAGATQALLGQNPSGKRTSFDGIDFSAFNVGSAGGTFTGITNRGVVQLGSFSRRQFSSSSDNSSALLEIDLLKPAGSDASAANNQKYYDSILSKAYAKGVTGLHPSLTDLWSSMLAYHFINGTTSDNFYTNDTSHGSSFLWSSLRNTSAFQNQKMAFPIMTLHTQTPTNGNELQAWSQRMVYEVTPYEMGSHDPRLNAMSATQYLGTHATGGKPDNDKCQTGFDEGSLIIGTSSSPFYNQNEADGNQPNVTGFGSDGSTTLNNLLAKLKSQLPSPSRRYDVGNWPNPFKNIGNYSDSTQDWLNLGGAQNFLPIEQLMVKARNVSVIIVLDSTGETTENKWPDGTAMQIAANRVNGTLSTNGTHQAFPPIPSGADFLNTGVSLRPTFFGCYPTLPPAYPLIIYIPNAPPVDGSAPATNPDTFKTSYSQEHQKVFLAQSAVSATSGFMPKSTEADPQFSLCFQCALVERSRIAVPNPASLSSLCNQCFDKYCYNPASPPSKSAIVGRKLVYVDPDLQNEGFLKQHGTQLGIGIAAAVAALIAIIAAFIFWRRRRNTGRRRRIPGPINKFQLDIYLLQGYSRGLDFFVHLKSAQDYATGAPPEVEAKCV